MSNVVPLRPQLQEPIQIETETPLPPMVKFWLYLTLAAPFWVVAGLIWWVR